MNQKSKGQEPKKNLTTMKMEGSPSKEGGWEEDFASLESTSPSSNRNHLLTSNMQSSWSSGYVEKSTQGNESQSIILPSTRIRRSFYHERRKSRAARRKKSRARFFYGDEESAFDADVDDDSNSTLEVNKTTITAATSKTSTMSFGSSSNSLIHGKLKQKELITPPRGINNSSFPYVDLSPISLSFHSPSPSSSISCDLEEETKQRHQRNLEQEWNSLKKIPTMLYYRSIRKKRMHPVEGTESDDSRIIKVSEVLKNSYMKDVSDTLSASSKKVKKMKSLFKPRRPSISITKSLIIRLALFISLYNVSTFILMAKKLHQYPIVSKEVKLKTFQVAESRPNNHVRIFDYEFRNNNQMTIFPDSNERIAIKRTLGGLYPIHNNEQEVKAFKRLNRDRSRGLGKLDIQMYNVEGSRITNGSKLPRIFSFDQNENSLKQHVVRELTLYPTIFSDNTQLYGIRDSGDPALSKMEPIVEDKQTDCIPMADWQTTYHPSCNMMHELDLVHQDDVQLIGKKGYWRNAWKVDLVAHNSSQHTETLILKTPKYDHNFEQAYYEHDRVDAQAMERQTFSPHVINIYGFCGRSVISEFANGPRLGTLADKAKKRTLKRLEIARDIAMGLSHVHFGRGNGEASFVHLDVNPANIVVVDKTLKVNDFNIGIMLKRNSTSGMQCGFPAQFPNPQWRSPEEVNNSPDLNEKVDVFSMGHIFFRMICGHEPWNSLEIGGKPSTSSLTEKVKAGILPRIPDYILNTSVPEEKVIRDAMLACYTLSPEERPSSRDIAKFLDDELFKLSSQENEKLKNERKK